MHLPPEVALAVLVKHRRIRHLAVDQGTTVKAVVTRALEELLKREEGRSGTKKVR
jgi:hypothetical protein